MVVVIVAAFGIASWIMVTDKVEFGQLKTSLAFNEEKGITEVLAKETKFTFSPHLFFVDTISFSNKNEDISHKQFQLNNNMINGVEDRVVFESHARAVKTILENLDKGRKTNLFSQFFSGGQSGGEYLTQTYTGPHTFDEACNGVWIKIVFAKPQFVVNRDPGRSWRIEEYDARYTQPFDEGNTARGQSQADYNNRLISAISIPLGNAKNGFERQTWYISVGSQEAKNTTSLGFTFTTYGNYYKLLQYVNGIDDAFLF